MIAAVFISVVALAILIGGLAWLARLVRRELTTLRVESSSQLADRTAEVDRRLGLLAETMDARLGGIDARLQAGQTSSGATATKIAEKLGELGGTASQMLARANDLARLEQALRPPKARGGFGELLLENLLRDQLPPSAYAMQHGFSSGDRVDAVVKVDRLISVDSKFPLDNYERIVEAEGDEEQLIHEKAFARDVRNHVDAIAAKYIRPEDGTYDFAFMYIPVEAVYYEIACGRSSSILAYAREKRVFPVSPTSFVAYLQVIILGMKGMQIEQHAHEVMAYVASLDKDFGQFKKDFDLVGTHLAHAQSKFGEADKRLDKLESKLERAGDDQQLEPDVPRLPRAVEAA